MLNQVFVFALVWTSLATQQSDNTFNARISNDECVRRIYQDCNYPTHFTDEELENVRQFLKYQFTVLADIKPDKPLCPKLDVQQNWKCLSKQQKERVANVWKTMYKRGDIERMANLHAMWWPAWHKTHESGPAHRWFVNELQKIMQSIDPGTTLPYWDPYTYGSQPERSSIWETLGHSGRYSNAYEVPDGIYPELKLSTTLKRHWPNGIIKPWMTPEFIANLIQSSSSWPDLNLKVLGLHFGPHLNVGGYEGQMSYRNAPYDVIFYPFHNAVQDKQRLKWQLQRKEFLTPLSYNLGKVFDQINGSLRDANIFTDTLTGVPSVTVRETFWLGFGDYCSISDQFVRPINNLMKGIRDPIPTAAKRLPKHILEKYFPSFNSGNFNALSHTLEEVGECNTECRPIPEPTWMRNTEQGRMQFEAFGFDEGRNITYKVEFIESAYKQMWVDLNQSGYCSPYVTTY